MAPVTKNVTSNNRDHVPCIMEMSFELVKHFLCEVPIWKMASTLKLVTKLFSISTSDIYKLIDC